MRGAEGVPERDVGEILEAGGLVDLAVKPQVIAIGIVEERRHLKCAEERRVENRLLVIGASLNPDRA